ncbi:MAG TPA: hypothetical protein VJR89_11230, partial [Polyangiales bacterium]|nr:hypothetical protein [Polyangiales bacterium]
VCAALAAWSRSSRIPTRSLRPRPFDALIRETRNQSSAQPSAARARLGIAAARSLQLGQHAGRGCRRSQRHERHPGRCELRDSSSEARQGPGSRDSSVGPLVPQPGEKCYEFKTHQSTTKVDAAPYSIGMGEHYEQFYFKAPWPNGTVA